jgi:group II intron reverse transcriptase/maturase
MKCKDSRMTNTNKFLATLAKLGKEGIPAEKVYRRMRSRDLFIRAYGKLAQNKGRLTQGVTSETIDGMSLNRIDAILGDLEGGRYAWQPAKRVYIPKTNGQKRPLGIPTWRDKLTQEVMRQCLESYFEPIFRESSHGFRPQRGCESALVTIKKEWRGVNWFIEGDITGCFDNLSHEVILECLGRHIKDNRFLKLIRTLLERGYEEKGRRYRTQRGIPQGSIIGPLLTNIVLHELDVFVEDDLIPDWTKGKHRRINPEYRRYEKPIKEAAIAGDKQKVRTLKAERRQVSCTLRIDPDYRRLRYVRYADDFILGFIGSYQEAKAIKESIRIKLAVLGLELNEAKTAITNSVKGRSDFLGYEIGVSNLQRLKQVPMANGKYKHVRSTTHEVQLYVPSKVIAEWVGRYSQNGKAYAHRNRVNHSEFEIVSIYQAEWRWLATYYQLAINRKALRQVEWYMWQSLSKTLGTKLKCLTSVIRQKFEGKRNGKKTLEVSVEDPRTGKRRTAYFGGISLRRVNPYREKVGVLKPELEVNLRRSANELGKRLLAERCELCGSQEHIEVHHIKSIKSMIRENRGKRKVAVWQEAMMRRNRNTLVVCHPCHQAIHHGKYDDRRLQG